MIFVVNILAKVLFVCCVGDCVSISSSPHSHGLEEIPGIQMVPCNSTANKVLATATLRNTGQAPLLVDSSSSISVKRDTNLGKGCGSTTSVADQVSDSRIRQKQ
ncbi:hypothetical protein NW761_004337 [Fusarium oxysporum]|nr:hypothetical protein NW758_003693 [Fusarium oxysporum]KAJ4058421.1 hypothetical protein NW753_006077 [Fusarium oxysporum]KAJ4068402.1 hypothetical protein NW763_001960 [Fusarium oxysporum]KAJ4079515.1 hypothetical protein NW756_011483 [Fusarium oxysporum]KAJ4096377.1 hypothetical protein NW761_004337 [Fusarium oxysporum]